MPNPKVYIETTIIGFLTARSSRDLVTQSKQQTTKEWWSEERSDFDLFCSALVKREAGAGDSEAARERLQKLEGIPVLGLTCLASPRKPETSLKNSSVPARSRRSITRTRFTSPRPRSTASSIF